MTFKEEKEGLGLELPENTAGFTTVSLQLAYKAWTNDAVCALRMRMEDEGGVGNSEWDEEGLRRRHSGGTTVDSKAGFVW